MLFHKSFPALAAVLLIPTGTLDEWGERKQPHEVVIRRAPWRALPLEM
jgi:hypothetical protein